MSVTKNSIDLFCFWPKIRTNPVNQVCEQGNQG